MTRSGVSVVIPVHNGERHVAETLESVVVQRDVDLEVIAVDDGSTDGSAALLAEISADMAGSADLVVISHDTNRGVAAARTTGVNAARHDLVAFCDQDDLWSPDKLAVQLRALNDTACDLVLGHVEHFIEPGLDPPTWFAPRWGAGPLPGWLLGCALVRRTVFDRIGTFDPDLRHGGDDVEWFARVADHDVATVVVDEVVLSRRVHDRNLSRLTAAHNAELLEVIRGAATTRRRAGRGERIEP